MQPYKTVEVAMTHKNITKSELAKFTGSEQGILFSY